MKTSHKCWWILLVVAIPTMITLRLYVPTSPGLPRAHAPPMPSHSNSRLLPFKYWHHRSLYPESYSDASCTRFPSLSDIRYAANTWQLLQVVNGSIYLYGAYWDNRFKEPLVRVLIYSDVLPLPKLYCQLWFLDDNEPQTKLANILYAWQVRWKGPYAGLNEPYILSCSARRHAPDEELAPTAVSVVSAPCDQASNVLNVQGAPFEDATNKNTSSPNKISVAVCVKTLQFQNDISMQLVEWLQIMKHFGVVKAFLYTARLHPITKRTLKFYEKSDFVVVTEVSHPPQITGVHFDRISTIHNDLRRELLPLNDCLYRNLGRYDWLAVIDTDELIVPVRDGTWSKLIEEEISQADGLTFDALTFLNYYVLDGAQTDLLAPKYARLLAHTWRARNASPADSCIKSFINTSSVIAMHNHVPIWCRKKHCKIRFVEGIDARLLHYRQKCAVGYQSCEELTDVVRDDVMSKWRKQVLQEIDDVYKNIEI